MIALIDAIGPFFLFSPRGTTNWSKIPFSDLEKDEILDPKKIPLLEKHFCQFLDQAVEMGANSISIDDLAHLVIFPEYPKKIRKKIVSYQKLYARLFSEARARNMKIFCNTDICFSHPTLAHKDFSEILQESCKQAFQNFPIEGIVFRLGENDGRDVHGDFLSTLSLKTPRAANTFLKKILPLFEKHKKTCIVRTWTVGAHQIGDLSWNPKTYMAVFGDVTSNALVVSMKYGESDFYRFAPKTLNPLFFLGKHQKILELQTRREREGFGMHPFYTGWEYAEYLEQARKNPNFYGISVWCQTGGWSQNRDLTFIRNSSSWNELNTIAAFRVFWKQKSASEVADAFLQHPKGKLFLRKYRDVFLRLLYPKSTSHHALYFRRLRLPPLLWVFWNQIVITPLISSLHSEKEIQHLPSAEDFEELVLLGKDLNIPNFSFQTETLQFFLSARKVLVGKGEESDFSILKSFPKKYPETYQVSLRIPQNPSFFLRFFPALLLRKNQEYRLFDRFLLIPGTMKVFSFLGKPFLRKNMPDFVDKQCMPIDTVLIS